MELPVVITFTRGIVWPALPFFVTAESCISQVLKKCGSPRGSKKL
jgi:hypothetical protein